MKVLYLDECKQKPFLLVGFLLPQVDSQKVRKQLSALRMPGQRSIHFKLESPRRRREILSLLNAMKCEVFVVKCFESKAPRGHAINTFLERNDFKAFVFELDETTRFRDHELFRGHEKSRTWDHRQRHEEPLLWVADAVAWCVNRGGEWERMVRPMIVETIEC